MISVALAEDGGLVRPTGALQQQGARVAESHPEPERAAVRAAEVIGPGRR